MTETISVTTATVIVVCPHANKAVEAYGHIAISGGDVLDTTEEHLVCTDCGAYLDDPEIDFFDIPF